MRKAKGKRKERKGGGITMRPWERGERKKMRCRVVPTRHFTDSFGQGDPSDVAMDDEAPGLLMIHELRATGVGLGLHRLCERNLTACVNATSPPRKGRACS